LAHHFAARVAAVALRLLAAEIGAPALAVGVAITSVAHAIGGGL
jgi:hypothetical protein